MKFTVVFSIFVGLSLSSTTVFGKIESLDDLDYLPIHEYKPRAGEDPDKGVKSDVEFYDHPVHGAVCVKIHTFKYLEAWLEIEVLQYLKAQRVQFVSDLVGVYKLTVDVGTVPVTVTRYVGKYTLRQVLLNRALAVQLDMSSVTRQTVQIAKELHDVGIAHRDLSPSNIMLDENNNVHIIDFGLAVFLQPNQVLLQRADQAALRIIRGNGWYRGPETIPEGMVEDIRRGNTNLSRDARQKFLAIYTRSEQGRPNDIFAIGATIAAIYEGLKKGPFVAPAGTPRDKSEKITFENTIVGFDHIQFKKTPDLAKAFIRWLLTPDAKLRPTAAVIVAAAKFFAKKSGMAVRP